MWSRGRVDATDLQALILGGLRIADLAVVVVSGIVAFWIRHDSWALPQLYGLALIAAILLTVNFMQIARVYVFEDLTRLYAQLGRTTAAWIAVLLMLLAIAFLTQTSVAFSRTFALAWLGLGLAGFILVRLVLMLQIERMRAAGRFGRSVAVIGAGEPAKHLLNHLDTLARGRYRVVGVFDDQAGVIGPAVEGHRILGTVDDLLLYARSNPLDEIVIALPWQDSDKLMAIAKKLKSVPINVKLCPNYGGWSLPARGFEAVAGIPMLAVHERPIVGWSLLLKEIEDRLIAALLLVLLLPVFAIIALAIKLDSQGPVFFRQKRYGFNNNPITVFKFRTMFAGPAEESSVPQARRNDPRVTRLGALLRRSSLDELPQLFNVLRGEMSLVGPRPHAVAHNEQYAKVIDDYLSRHRVKPGITGWAQINGLRGETDTPDKMRRRVQYDLYYIDNWSLFFDLKILLLTPFVGFVNRNAY
jgi:putative colanic acid biosynthesis UDP-glucose lipid carrier transferase